MRKSRLFLLVFIVVSVMASSMASPNASYATSASINLHYQGPSYSNVTSQSKTIVLSGNGYSVNLSEVSGTYNGKGVGIWCTNANGGSSVNAYSASTYFFSYNPLPTVPYVVFHFDLFYPSGQSNSSIVRGTVSRV